MTAPTKPRLRWTHSVGTGAWVGDVRRPLVLGWDVAEPSVFSICLGSGRRGTAVEWWLTRQDGTAGVDMPVGDWMWQCSRGGVPHVAIRPFLGDAPIFIREEILGRFLAATEWWVALGAASFDAEAAALLGGAS